MRRGRGLWIGVGVALLLVLLLAANSLRTVFGLSAVDHTPEELSALLSPYYRITRPDPARFAPPHPTALLASGCDGPKDNLEAAARDLAAAGWASVQVDSHGPRGLLTAEVWRLVCAGQLLNGSERAADLAVALDDVRRMDFADPGRIALIGASHGGWAILELLAFHGIDKVPGPLTRWPDSIAAEGLAGVNAAVLAYPYCGPVSRVALEGWQADIPVRMLLVKDDAIVDETDCLELAARMQARGREVRVEEFTGVTHGFDQREKSALSTLTFDAEAAERARRLSLDFLAETQSRRQP
ncbi:Dienelactone hydrolase family protein [Pseudoruegeria aquimaris]|uniref:Dienelactone hydrolase family protein n=1 Tax=Pseudoruegeria aquimaris TaxID=393663 RepID=A0A1Y5RC87_9RHOB|nr:dienelactone hydrolase family protein [Pseudoruegeria aquimaris]SLN11556.1 Dienelactone hydrolase family protein [Pseudoruegeria aquimaris]